MNQKINFASDNYSPVHPRVLEEIHAINTGSQVAYGGDTVTLEATRLFKKYFGESTEAHFVWNGTAANVLGLQLVVRPYESILCSELAHIQVDECGAPEKNIGCKLVGLPQRDGKITLKDVEAALGRRGDQHAVQPKVISITQATEYGALYSISEIQAFAEFAHQHQMWLHMDGARLSNAAVTTQCTLKQMTTDAGVDILSFGGTKNGLMGAEAVVILNPQLQKQFEYIRKQGLHLASKMRYLSAQWIANFKNDLWRENAQQANAMAQFLCSEMQQHCPQYTISHPVQANSVFCCLPKSMILKLQEQFAFYVWNESLSNDQSEVRWMCSFNTQQDEVIQLVQSVKQLSEAIES